MSTSVGRRSESTGEAAVRLLHEHGTELFFGIPGVHTLEYFRGIASTGSRHLLNRSELGAVHAADGYARTTGKPGVAILISGPGLTSAATAIAQAHHDSVPLLILSTVVPSKVLGRGWGALHDLPDQRQLMGTITARSEHVDDPAALPAVLRRAFEDLAGGRPRPIHVQLPVDVVEAEAPALELDPPDLRTRAPSPDELERALDLLTGAREPIIVIGGGAVDAGAEVAELAERLGAPVALSLNAKGTVPDGHPLSLSTTLPTEATIEAVSEADLVLAIGTEFSEVDRYYSETALRPNGRLIRVDVDRGQLDSQFQADAAIAGDAAQVAQVLSGRLEDRGHRPAEAAGDRAESIRSRVGWWARSAPLMPLVEAVGAALPEDSMVAVDSTKLAYIGQNAWPAERPRSWMIPAGFGSLGPALPMAIGAAAGSPERPSICVVGDGGLLYTIGEMATAAGDGPKVVALVFNNQGYGEIRDEFDLAGIPHVGTDAQARDYRRIAEGFGWLTARPPSIDEVGGSIGDAVAAERSTLIELTPALLG